MRITAFLLTLVVSLILTSPANGQKRETPYWASLRVDEVNMRVGPSADYKIDWVYRRAQLPVKIVRLKEGWRLIQDPDGTQGWMVARLLNPQRTALVVGEGLAAVRDAPADSGTLQWNAEPGVVGALGSCEEGWCELDIGGRKGWVQQSRLWGPGEP